MSPPGTPAGRSSSTRAHSRPMRRTAWLVARVTEFDHTVGVMMAKAPDDFLVDLKLRGDRVDRSKLLIIDWLIGKAATPVYQNIPVPSLGDRCQILQELLAL